VVRSVKRPAVLLLRLRPIGLALRVLRLRPIGLALRASRSAPSLRSAQAPLCEEGNVGQYYLHSYVHSGYTASKPWPEATVSSSDCKLLTAWKTGFLATFRISKCFMRSRRLASLSGIFQNQGYSSNGSK